MYNRYIPQSDGTHSRRSIPEQPGRPQQPSRHQPPPGKPTPETAVPREPSPGALSFFKNLLPGDFGTEDLLIVLLLLLMAGDSPEERNSALLTLALYLFL